MYLQASFFSWMKWFPLEMYWTFSFTERCRWWSLNHLKFTFSYLSAAELNIVHSLQCMSNDIVELLLPIFCVISGQVVRIMNLNDVALLLCLDAFWSMWIYIRLFWKNPHKCYVKEQFLHVVGFGMCFICCKHFKLLGLLKSL